MGSVSAPAGKTLYVLEYQGFYWLTTLATNRAGCWKAAKPFCRTSNYKKELAQAGYKCVPVKIVGAA